MPKIFRYVLMLIVALVLIVFLVSNRQTVTIGMDPFAPETPALAVGPVPLWFALAASMFGGYFLGAIGMWASGKNTRKKARDRKKEIKQLKKEADLAASPQNLATQSLPAVK